MQLNAVRLQATGYKNHPTHVDLNVFATTFKMPFPLPAIVNSPDCKVDVLSLNYRLKW